MKYLISTMVMLFICASASFALDEAAIVGIWLFDDGEGDVAEDSSGNDRHGTLISEPEWVDDGKFGGALQFAFAAANNVRVPIPHNDTVTIAMWGLYTDTPTTNIGLLHVQAGNFENADPGSKTIGMWVENTNLLWGRIIPEGGGNINLPKNESLEIETWYHIAMVVDADAGTATQYVDAREVGQVAYPGTLTQYDFANIGRQGNETWEGMIDEVIILSEALSENDLKALMDGIDVAFPVEPKDRLTSTWGKLKLGK